MLKVTLHAGPLKTADFTNRLGWIEVAYASKPGPFAHYKAVVTTIDHGAMPPIALERYPRYAATVWDLVARVISIHLTPAGETPAERLWPFEQASKFIPYATALSAAVDAQFPGPRGHTRTVATCELTRMPGARGRYEAVFTEDGFDEVRIAPFVHRPARLEHWRLLQTALAWRLAGEEELPPRPFIFQPEGVATDEGVEVCIKELAEPVRMPFSRWLVRNGHGERIGFAREQLYLDFLHALA